MQITESPIPGAYLIEPRVFEDERGYFFESFHLEKFAEQTGLRPDFVQDNQSLSSYGVLRGLHFQIGAAEQAKLVRVLEGEVLDVIVDLRPDSPAFGKHYSVRLSAENKRQLFVPRGCAHGFAVLSERAVFYYKCDNYYNPAEERGIRFDDPALGIDWQVPAEKMIVSAKDKILPGLKEYSEI